jgi:hypothetical protein
MVAIVIQLIDFGNQLKPECAWSLDVCRDRDAGKP